MCRRTFSGFFIILVLAGAASWLGCSEKPAGNNPPIIRSMNAEPDTFVADSFTIITVEAEDPDGDKLQYNWEATASWLQPLSGGANRLMLTNCCEIPEMRTTMIIAIVDDGRGGSARDSIRIWVVPAGVGP